MVVKTNYNNDQNTSDSTTTFQLEIPTLDINAQLTKLEVDNEFQTAKKKNFYKSESPLATQTGNQGTPPPTESVVPENTHAVATPRKKSKINLDNLAAADDSNDLVKQTPKKQPVEKSKPTLKSVKPVKDLRQATGIQIAAPIIHAATLLKTTKHNSFRTWLTKLFNGSKNSDRDLAISCANSILLAAQIATKQSAEEQGLIAVELIQNLVDTYNKTSFLSKSIKQTCFNAIEATAKLLVKNTANIEQQIQFVQAVIELEQKQRIYYPFIRDVINQVISNMGAPQNKLNPIEKNVHDFFHLIEQRNERINRTRNSFALKQKIDEPILENLKVNIENKINEERHSHDNVPPNTRRRKHYKTSSLPPKKTEEQKVGSIRGSYIYLGRKETFVGGVEPGFVGIRMGYASFEALFEEIVANQVAANNPAIVEREQAYQQSDKSTIFNRIEYFLKDNNKCRNVILNEFAKQGHSLKMVKLDFLDGKKVTISPKAAEKAGTVKSMARGNSFLHSIFSKLYRFFRRTSSDQQSLNAVKEYFVTQQIAGNILGDRVQQAELEPRWNEIQPGIYQREYAISVGMNSTFKDFRKEFVDPFGDRNGQRVKVDHTGSFVKNKNGDYIAVETKGLAETFALQTVFGNFDAFGSTGGNGGYDEKGYFTIDIGHAFEQDQNKILNSVTPYLLVPSNKTTAKNFSLFYNTSLVDRVKGLLLLHRAFTGTSLPDALVQSYGPEFVEQYAKVRPISEKFKEYIEKFKAEKNGHKYLETLFIMQKRWNQNVEKLLAVGKNYLNVSADEVSLIDALAKLTSNVSNFNHVKSVPRIQLNHLRFDTEKGSPTVWVKQTEENGQIVFVATNTDKTPAQLKNDIEDFVKAQNLQIPEMKMVRGQLTMAVTSKDLAIYCQAFNEQKIAEWKKCPLASNTMPQQTNTVIEVSSFATIAATQSSAVKQVANHEIPTETIFASPLGSAGKTLLERMSAEQVAKIPHAKPVHDITPVVKELQNRFETHNGQFDFQHHVTLIR